MLQMDVLSDLSLMPWRITQFFLWTEERPERIRKKREREMFFIFILNPRSGTSWRPHDAGKAPERHLYKRCLDGDSWPRDGTIWLEESHSLIKVDETASLHRCSGEMILIYVDANTYTHIGSPVFWLLGRTSWLPWNVRRVVVSRRVLPPSLSDGNLWGEGDGKGVETSERVRRGRASSYEKKTVHYIYIYTDSIYILISSILLLSQL